MKVCLQGIYGQRRPDHPVHHAVWLQHSLSAFSIWDTLGYIHIYFITYTVIRLCGLKSWLIWIFTVRMYPKGIAQHVPYFYSKYLGRPTCANSVDPDPTPHNAASDLGLHCLHLMLQFLDTAISCQMGLLKCQDTYKGVR